MCDPSAALTTSAVCFAAYTATLVASRVITPLVVPNTYAKLANQPGAHGYWHSSVASALNGCVNTVLVVLAWRREPRLLWGTPDAFITNDDSCSLVVVFLTWIAFDLCQLCYYWRHWEGRVGMLVHHVSAIAAWALYLEGGYAHAVSLVGMLCEATNPFMNLRYFFSTCGMKESTAYLVNGAAFCLSWLLIRICYAIPMPAYLFVLQWDSLRRCAARSRPPSHASRGLQTTRLSPPSLSVHDRFRPSCARRPTECVAQPAVRVRSQRAPGLADLPARRLLAGRLLPERRVGLQALPRGLQTALERGAHKGLVRRSEQGQGH